MEPFNITYRIRLDDKVTEEFNYNLDGKTFDLIADDVVDPPEWTQLSFRQCSHCTLKAEDHPHCPMALQLHGISARFHGTRSIDKVHVEVITPNRRVSQNTEIQIAIASMLGLVFPTCGCPITSLMKPMARFHVPLASEEETVFHVTGMYLLAQYFKLQSTRQGKIEFDGLTKIYEDLHILNTAVASRLRGATTSDSVKNAVTLIDMYSTLVPMLLEDQLVEMRAFFAAYLPADALDEKPTTNYLEKAKAFKLELMPIAGERDKDDMPEWMKEAKGLTGVMPAIEIPAAEATKPAAPERSPLLDREFSFSLEPIGNEKPAAPVKGKASFALPDDEPPPPKKP